MTFFYSSNRVESLALTHNAEEFTYERKPRVRVTRQFESPAIGVPRLRAVELMVGQPLPAEVTTHRTVKRKGGNYSNL